MVLELVLELVGSISASAGVNSGAVTRTRAGARACASVVFELAMSKLVIVHE